MQIEISQGIVEINIPEEYTKIGIKHSGGLDSTIVSYMLALYKRDERPDIELIPITCIQNTKPFQWVYANMSQRKITELTGIEFGKHYFRAVDTQHILVEQRELLAYTYNNGIIDGHFYGITLNPPLDAFPDMSMRDLDRDVCTDNQKHPLTELWEATDETRIKTAGCSWRPLVNIDKKGVCELYNKLGVLGELFPLTHSCENYNEHTMMQLDLSKHCGLSCCWWCQERLWGFGKLDALTDEQIKPSMD